MLIHFVVAMLVPLNAFIAMLLVVQLNKSSTQDLQGSSKLGSKDESTVPSSMAGFASIFPSTASTFANPLASGTSPTGIANLPNIEAVRRAQELAARLGFHPDPQFAPLINTFPGHMVTDVAIPQKPTKAPVLRLDAQGREIDEHGNVVNVTKPSNLSTLKVWCPLSCFFLCIFSLFLGFLS